VCEDLLSSDEIFFGRRLREAQLTVNGEDMKKCRKQGHVNNLNGIKFQATNEVSL